MKFLTIDKIKQHLRLDCTCEAELLEDYGNSAEETVLDLMGMSYDEVMEKYSGVPSRVMQASLMLVDTWYQHRTPVADRNMSVIPYTFDILMKPFVKL